MEKGLIFTYGLTYGGLVTSLIYPFYGLLIYFMFAIISPPTMWFWLGLQGRYSLIVASGLLAGWTFSGFGGWRFGQAAPIVYSLLAYIAWAFISTFANGNLPGSWEWCIAQLKIVVPFIVGITLIDSMWKLKAIAWTLMLSQAYNAYEFNLAYWDGFNRVAEVGHAGMDNNCVCIAMATSLGLAFFLGIREKRLWVRAICFVSALLICHVPMFAMSRGAMLAMCVTGAVAFIVVPKKPMSYVYLLIAVLIGIRLAGPTVVQRFSTVFKGEEDRDSSAQSRVDMWRNCMTLTYRHPVVGVGPAQWKNHADEFGWAKGKEAHSLWFQTAAEMGFPGIGLLMFFYGWTIYRMWGILRHPPPSDEWYVDFARMTIAALTGFVVSATFVTINGLEIPYYVVLISAGSLKLLSAEQEANYAQARQMTLDSAFNGSGFGGEATAQG